MKIIKSRPLQGYIFTEIITLPIAVLVGYIWSGNYGGIGWLSTPALILVSTITYWGTVKFFNKIGI